MTDYRYENIQNLIKEFSTIRDEYVKQKQEQEEKYKKLVELRNEIKDYLEYHGLKIHGRDSYLEINQEGSQTNRGVAKN